MAIFVIKYASEESLEALHHFHTTNAGEFVWPRTLPQLLVLIRSRSVFVVELDGAPVGMAYTLYDADHEPPRWEFGGAFISDEHRGNGLAGGISRLALIALFSVDDPALCGSIIAHVHKENPSNIRDVLSKLGFFRDGEEVPPIDLVPENMRRNDRGEVVGELFRFTLEGLRFLIEWLREPIEGYLVEIDWFHPTELAEDLQDLVDSLNS